MKDVDDELRTEGATRRRVLQAFVGLVALGALLFALGAVARWANPFSRLMDAGRERTAVTQQLVVDRMRSVAQLVSSETTMRDVVVYENSRFGSTKRSLVVVTGRILSGIDLDRGTEVRIDHERRRVHIELPHATVLGVEITELRTYDEQSGLWNPFRPADRDTIYRLAREQLENGARDMGIAEHAEKSAREVLQALVSTDGYTTEVSFGRTAPDAARPDAP
jgi:hypothetical protein